MKKIGLFLLLTAAVGFSSCSKTDTPPSGNPIAVTVTPATTTAKGGDSLTFHVVITDDNTLKDVVVTQSLGGGTATQIASYSLTGKSYSFDQGYRVPMGFTGEIAIVFTVDDANNTNTATAKITVGSTAADINSYSAVLLASYGDNTAGSFYGSSNNTVYTLSNSKANASSIDMIFFYGATNKYSLAAPSDGVFDNSITSLNVSSWSPRNATKFKTTALADFTSITNAADVATAYTNASGSEGTLSNNLAAGNILAFKTAGKYGLCKIVDVANGDASGKGLMHIQVVVQK